MRIGDWVLRAIGADLAARPPERGGALLGPRGRPLVTAFLPDLEAASTSASWRPSRALDARVKEAEADGILELKGLVHSHPAGLDHPSDQDARELAVGLSVNPHMASYLAPIVTQGEPGPLGTHELALPGGKVSWFGAFRARDGGAEVRAVEVAALPLLGDLERSAEALGGGGCEVLLAHLDGEDVPAGRIQLADGGELLVLASELHPALPPVALLTRGGETRQLDLRFRVAHPPERRLAAALRAALPPAPGDALFARSGGLLGPALAGRRALVAGLGSVGSYAAELLARAGVGALTLLDPEAVAAENLSRTAYEAEDVGRPKADALARRLHAVNPALSLELHPVAVAALGVEALDALVAGVDLVVAATDDPAAQRALNRFAYARGRPAVFVGLYAGAEGGEVILSVPERTACYLCATRARHGVEERAGRVARDADYGTGRLAAEPALAADVQHVASAAVKLALALLAPPGAGLAAFAAGALDDGASYLTLSTVARYWFYPEVFGDTPGQGAYQAVWLTPARAADCPVCGVAEAREDPRATPLGAPGRDAFRGPLHPR